MTIGDEAPVTPPPAGEAAGFVAFLKDELAPAPGRLGNVLRIAALTILVVVASETLRIPLPAYSAYIVFFASKEETASTILTGIILTIAATFAVLAALLVYVVSAGEPGLRLPLMALTAFTGVYLSRLSPLGPAAFAAGFVMTISLTLIDVIPPTAPLPPSEILTQTVLWLWVVVMLPIGSVVLVNLLTGRDPDELFRQVLAARLETAGRLLLGKESGGPSDRKRLAAFLRSGMAAPLRHLKFAGLAHRRPPHRVAADRALVARTYDLMTLAVEWQGLGPGRPGLAAAAERCGETLLSAARALSDGAAVRLSPPSPSASLPPDACGGEDPAAVYLLGRIDAVVARTSALVAERRTADTQGREKEEEEEEDAAEPAARRLLVADAFTNPEHLRFALKTTLAVMIAYVAYNLLDWPDIRTAMITCFFVTFGNVGETVHRMTLRLAGALIGGGLGLAAVVFLMPVLTSITGLCLMIGGVALVAGWVATSSDRLAYAGMQMALAFFLCVLVGYGPHVDLALARDRVVGILLGNVIVSLVFSTVWPVSAIAQAKTALAEAIGRLGGILRRSAIPDAAVLALDDALARTRRLLSFDPFEPRPLKASGIDAADADLAQALLRPAVVLGPADDPPETMAYREALGAWLAQIAQRLASPAGDAVTPPPVLPADVGAAEGIAPGRAAWYRTLDERAGRLDAAVRARLAERGDARS